MTHSCVNSRRLRSHPPIVASKLTQCWIRKLGVGTFGQCTESPSDSSEHPCVISPTDEILGSWVDVPKRNYRSQQTESKKLGSPNAQKDEVVQRVSQAELKRPVRTAIVRARRTIVKSPVPMAIPRKNKRPSRTKFAHETRIRSGIFLRFG